jgi:hypothetical protein
MIKMKSAFNVLIKFINGCLIVLLAFSMIHCKNAKKETATQKQTAEQSAKPVREKPRLVYDDRGNIIERHAKSYRKQDESIRSVDSYYYKYDEQNNLIDEVKESYTVDGELKYKNVNFYSYNDKNQRIELRFFSYDKNDSLQRQARTTFEYNDLGHPVKEQSYFADGTIKGIIIRDPNEKGELLSEEYIHYNPDGSKKDHKKYYYTEYGLGKTEDLMEK